MCGKYGVGFCYSNYVYGCGISAEIINMDLKFVILGTKLLVIIN